MTQSVYRTSTQASISGTRNAWRKVEEDTPRSQLVPVELEIQGDSRSGFYLMMAPEGFFTADIWCESLEEAFEEARECFGVARASWRDLPADQRS